MISILVQIKDIWYNAFAPIVIAFDYGIFFGLLGTYLAILSLKRGKQKKGFEIRQCDTSYKTKIPDDFADKIKINYKGQEVDNLINTTIYLQNTGNVELKNDDFNNDCVITFSHEIELLEYSINSSDEFTIIESKFKENSLYLKVIFIEPETFVKIDILYKCQILPDANLKVNLIRGPKNLFELKRYSDSEYDIGRAHSSSFIPLWFAICFGILCGFTYLIVKTLGLKAFDEVGSFSIPYGWFALIIIGALIPTVWICGKATSEIVSHGQKWLKIKAWNQIAKFEI